MMVRKMRVIILSRPFLFFWHRKGGASKGTPADERIYDVKYWITTRIGDLQGYGEYVQDTMLSH